MTAIIRLSRSETLQLALVAWTMVAMLVATQLSGLIFRGFFQPAAVCVALLTLAAFYDRRAPNFSLTLKSLVGFVGFSAVFCPLTYCLAKSGVSLADPTLKSIDLTMGFHADEIVSWVNARPTLSLLLWLAYFSAIPQTVLAVAWLGLRNHQSELNQFLTRFMLCAMLSAAFFAVAPAIGTPISYDIQVPAHYARTIEHLTALRDGSMTTVSLSDSEGLIGVPSFHCEWAILLIAALWKSPFRWPALLLNIVMIASTIPVGMHYAIDVISGFAVCAVVFLCEPVFGPALAPTRKDSEGHFRAANGLRSWILGFQRAALPINR